MPRLILSMLTITVAMVAACQKPNESRVTGAPADPAKPSEPSAPTTQPPAKPAEPAAPAQPDPQAAVPVDPAKPAAPIAAAPPVAAKPAPVGTNSPAEVRAIALMGKMADVFAGNAKNCDKLAVELKRFLVENRPALLEANATLGKLNEEEQIAFQSRNAAAQQSIGQRMQPGVAACSSNPKVQAAMREYPAN